MGGHRDSYISKKGGHLDRNISKKVEPPLQLICLSARCEQRGAEARQQTTAPLLERHGAFIRDTTRSLSCCGGGAAWHRHGSLALWAQLSAAPRQ